jgi:hypothetical protein
VVAAEELAAVELGLAAAAAEVELPTGAVVLGVVLRAAEDSEDARGLVMPLLERRLVVGGVGGVT